jgi:TrmH family RNA methyltransferase
VKYFNQKYIISMVSKNQIKLISSLHQKKFRQSLNLFIAEGQKVIQELLDANFVLEHLYQTESLFSNIISDKKTLIDFNDLKKISALTVPNNCLAVFQTPNPKPIIEKGLLIALDDIRDPGNFGTILRLCDWFGIEQVLCSKATVDLYNPKVIQATMGSVARVNINYLDLKPLLENTKLPVFCTFIEGENIYKTDLPNDGIIVMGNEANGISSEIETMINRRLTIPRFGNLQKTESLNVATATAIVLSEFRRG